jgi:hypothetical protein
MGFEALTAVAMKSTIVRDVTPCGLVEFRRYFGGTYSLLLQGERVNQAASKYQTVFSTETSIYVPYFTMSASLVSTTEMQDD